MFSDAPLRQEDIKGTIGERATIQRKRAWRHLPEVVRADPDAFQSVFERLFVRIYRSTAVDALHLSRMDLNNFSKFCSEHRPCFVVASRTGKHDLETLLAQIPLA